MSVLVDRDTRLCVSGITGREGSFHTLNNRAYGTNVVSGVTPGKGGQELDGIPVFDTFHEAVAASGANTAMVFVPPPFAADSILEAADAGIATIITITEGIPAHDELRVYTHLHRTPGVRLIGPNCPGVLSPGKANVGIIPASFFREGNIGVVSRSGTLTYQVGNELAQRGFGNSSIVGIGGDPVPGSSFVDVIELFEADEETELIVMSGEIGGDAEETAARYISSTSQSRSSPTSRASPRPRARRWVTPARSCPAPGNRQGEGRGTRGRRRPRCAYADPGSRDRSRRASLRAAMPGPPPLSFARGAPSLDIIDVEGLREAAQRAFANDPGGATAYGTAVGYVPLRRWIAERHGVAENQVLVTNGSMQADAFLFDEVVGAGDDVVVELPTYDRTLLVASPARREDHRDRARARRHRHARALRRRSTAACAEARPHHPELPEPRRLHAAGHKRERLLELSAQHGFVIFEDDPYIALRFRGEALPTMLSLDAGAGNVVYASSFSKTVCPGIRVGFLIGPAELIARDCVRATNTYISPSMVDAGIVYEFCVSGAIERSIETVRARFRSAWTRLRRSCARRSRERRSSHPTAATSCGSIFPTGIDDPRRCSEPPPRRALRSSAATTSCSTAARARYASRSRA